MKQSKDPFEAALEEEEESPAGSPVAGEELQAQTPAGQDITSGQEDDDVGSAMNNSSDPSASTRFSVSTARVGKTKDEDDEEEEENMDVEFGKFPSSADPTKMAKMQAILSQFTEVQMSRYESFRRSALQKSNMRRLLVSITGSQKISLPMTIVVCGIAKMFVGELVETARTVMKDRTESGPIRPCHIREAFRRLKLEGKVPRKSVPRLFR